MFALLALASAVSTNAALPGDSAAGKRLHDANCRQCHQPGVYTAKDRNVQSLEELRQQLMGCSHMAQKPLTSVEMQDLVKYLNEEFYKF